MTKWLDNRTTTGALGISLAVSVVSFGVYLTTICPTVSFTDSGELATVAATLGIAHPTGYPLFTLLGRIVSVIPVGSTVIFRLNMFSAVLTALSVGIMFLLMREVVSLVQNTRRLQRSDGATESGTAVPVAAAALVFGLGTTVWSQSTAIEVYALHLLLITLFLLLLLRGVADLRTHGEDFSRWLLLGAFVLGLSFANHMTTILLIPGAVYVVAVTTRSSRKFFRIVAGVLPFWLLGLSTYLYLPIRSAVNPPLDWGHPAEFVRLVWHVTGKQYRSWIFSSFASAERQFSYYVAHLPSEFQWVVLPVIALGLILLAWRNRRIFWFVLILWATCLAYAVNYDIVDIDSYFLLAHVAAGLALAVGFESIWQWMQRSLVKVLRYAGMAVVVGLPALAWYTHRAEVDQSDNWLVADYTHSILSALDSNALVISYQWDYFVSASLYDQRVLQERTDVTVVDKELLRRSWYYHQLERTAPWLIERSRRKVDAFLRELYKFEHDLPFDPAVTDWRYNEVINDFINKSIGERPVYVGPEIEPMFGSGLVRIPEGLLFRLARPGGPEEPAGFVLDLRPSRMEGRLAEGLRYQCAKMMAFRALWDLRQGNRAEAKRHLEEGLRLVPSYPAGRELLRRLESSGTE